MTLDALARIHQPPHERSLADARDHLRRACAALAATHVPDLAQRAELVRMPARLRDELNALETLGRRF